MKNRLLTTVSIATLLLLAEGLWVYALLPRSADASRNAAGTYSLPAGNPVVTGTSISSTWANSTLNDISTELSDSKSRSGKGDFTAPVRGADGSVSSPTWSWTNDTGSGYYRIGASDFGLSIAGTKTGEWTANGLRVANGAVATPSLSFFNDTGSGLYRIGSNNIGFAVNGVKVSEWTATGIVITSPAATALTALSGASGSITDISLGRTAIEGTLGVAAVANNYAQGSAAGDIVLRTSAGKLWFDTNNGSGTPSLAIAAANGGVIIGGGTAISKSVSGTASFSTGNMGTLTCVAATVTTTGSASGAPCAVGNSADPGDLRVIITCRTHTAGQCAVDVCNISSGTIDPADFTVRCTVFNP